MNETGFGYAVDEERCMHPAPVLTRRVLGSSVETVWEQCPACGVGIKAVKKATLSAARIAALPVYDVDLQDRRYRERFEARQQARETARAESDQAWRQQYEMHLLSDAWRVLRQRVMARDGGVCQGCGVRPASDAHHLTYDHLGDEFLFELIALCRTCHERLHGHRIGTGRNEVAS